MLTVELSVVTVLPLACSTVTPGRVVNVVPPLAVSEGSAGKTS